MRPLLERARSRLRGMLALFALGSVFAGLMTGSLPALAAAARDTHAPPGSAPLPATPTTCPTERRTTRHMDAWYGSTLAGSTVITDSLQLTDHVNAGLASYIQGNGNEGGLPPPDPRVLNGLEPWTNNSQASIEWVWGTPEHLPAEANLRTALASVSLPAPYHGVVFDAPASRGTYTYVIAQWDTVETCDGKPIDVHNLGIAEVSYFELNAHGVKQYRLYLPLVVK